MRNSHASASSTELFVAGIGASAGGLEALQDFVKSLEPGSPIAYLVAQHGAPLQDSLLTTLLRRETNLSVRDAADGMPIGPAHILVVPPGFDLSLDGAVVRLTPSPPHTPSPSIDTMLESIAQQFSERSIGIILSGTGSDGAAGMRCVKAAGGRCFVQDPASAQFPSMPLAAIEAACSDVIAPPGQLARRTVYIARKGPGDSVIAAAAPALLVDSAGLIHDHNAAAAELLGLNAATIHLRPALASRGDRYVERRVRNAIRSGRVSRRRIRLGRRHYQLVISPAGDLATLTLEDVSGLVHAQRRLEKRMQHLEDRNHLHHAGFDILEAPVAVVDAKGVIAATSSSWPGHEGALRTWGTGVNCLSLCASDSAAESTGRALRSVLRGQSTEASSVCGDAKSEGGRQHQYLIRGTGRGAVVVHVACKDRPATESRTKLLAAALDHVGSAVFVCDRSGLIEWVNRAFISQSGYGLEEVRGSKPTFLSSGQHGPSFWRRMWETVLRGGTWNGEVVNRSRWGRVYTVEQSVTPIRDASGEIHAFVIVQEDITARKEAEFRMQQITQRDALTGLFNRAVFHDRLVEAAERARSTGRRSAVLFLDLDRFKYVNDSLGHAAGDQLLIAVAQRLASVVSENAVLARLGADEFAILLRDVEGRDQIRRLADDIMALFVEPFQLAGQSVPSRVSIGAAIYPENQLTPSDMLRGADLAMYRAKSISGCSFEFYDEGLVDRARERVEIARDLAAGRSNGDLALAFQPQYDLRTGRMVGLEALLRWQTERWREIPVPKLIEIAEDIGIIHEIGEWVIGECCRAAAELYATPQTAVPISINLSPSQLGREETANAILDGLARFRLPADAIHVEITETALLQHSAAASNVISRLHKAGVCLVLDDFGTGYSSLTYLRQFPVSSVKIDLSFVQGIHRNIQDEAIINGIISMAHALGLEVIGEGVESDEQVQYLASNGCDSAQGFFLGTPQTLDSLLASAAAGG